MYSISKGAILFFFFFSFSQRSRILHDRDKTGKVWWTQLLSDKEHERGMKLEEGRPHAQNSELCLFFFLLIDAAKLAEIMATYYYIDNLHYLNDS